MFPVSPISMDFSGLAHDSVICAKQFHLVSRGDKLSDSGKKALERVKRNLEDVTFLYHLVGEGKDYPVLQDVEEAQRIESLFSESGLGISTVDIIKFRFILRLVVDLLEGKLVNPIELTRAIELARALTGKYLSCARTALAREVENDD